MEVDRKSIEHAHLRIDYLERDFQVMNKNLERLVDLQQKAIKHSQAVKWMVLGGLSFFVLENIGLIEAIKLIK